MFDKDKGDKRAFPVQAGMYSQTGMTMRQWYKGQALAGMDTSEFGIGHENRMTAICAAAADAMIAEDEAHKAKSQ